VACEAGVSSQAREHQAAVASGGAARGNAAGGRVRHRWWWHAWVRMAAACTGAGDGDGHRQRRAALSGWCG
jgi:hypothetical protein